MKVLECSSKGDRRFSAFYAKVEVNGKTDTIENHYQLAKRFDDGFVPKNWRDSKGRKPSHFEICNKKIKLENSVKFYDRLWEKYLDDNPHLVAVLSEYDDYSDMFKSKNARVCQADSIRRYMRNKNK